MRPLYGLATAAVQYVLFVGHPILSIYPRALDHWAGPGAFAAFLLLINLALSLKRPYTAAFATLVLYLAEAALTSPTLRLFVALPEVPPPSPWLGLAAALLTVATAVEGAHGLYLAAAGAPAAALLLAKDYAPRLDYTAGLALAAIGLALLLWATRPARG